MEDTNLRQLGTALRSARLAKGLGLKEVGLVAGVSPQAVGQWERGVNGPTTANLMAVAKLLEFDADAAIRGMLSSASTIIRPSGHEPSTVEPAPGAPRLSQFGDFDVEVRGITAGGSTESEFQFDGKVVGEVRRPPGAAKARGLFALHVAGNSMVEKYEPGDLIFLQESRHAEPGDYVVVELFPEQEGEAGKSFLKQLVRRTGRRVTCRQLNPPKEIEFDAGEVKQIYRVLKNRDLFG